MGYNYNKLDKVAKGQSPAVFSRGILMRIVRDIEIEGQNVKALFDTGAINTYVIKGILKDVPIRTVREPYTVALAGSVIEVKEYCAIEGKIEGFGFNTITILIDDLGKIEGKPIDAIIGALTMEQWEIIPNPKDGTLDLSGLKRREFTEF